MVSPSARVSIRSAFAVAALLLCSLPIPSRAEEGDTRAAEAVERPSFVLTLDSANFSDAIEKRAFIVVEFYAPWCGHCKNLAPEYEKAASFLSKHDPPIFLAKVDANDQANKELASMYYVKGFPTIKIFRNGGKNIQEYKGPRDADGIVQYLKKQAGPSSGELKSSDDVASLFDDKKVYIVGVFFDFSGGEFENYKFVADKMRSDYDFGHTVDAKLLPRGESTVKPPFVRLFKPFDELSVDSQDFNVDALEKFIEMSSVPLVTIFGNNPDHRPFVQKFFENDNDKALLFTNFSSDSFEAFESVYHDVARSLKGRKISFLLGDVDVNHGALQYFGLKGDQVPLIIVNKNEGQKYLKANIDPTQVAAWIKDALDGNVEQYIKSEPIPEDNNEPVKVVVADSLHDLVFNSGKNVLLEFYAPWCGHCKKLAPILEEVAVSLQNDADVIIAKMDATANDFPSEFEVRAYPTLYFRSASGKTVKYEGDRTKHDLISFIQGNKDSSAEAKPLKDEL